MSELTWAQARPMLYALRGLARMHATGASLSFPGGYIGTVEDDKLVLTDGPDGDIIFAQPADWPISQARTGMPDERQLTIDAATTDAEKGS